MKLKTPIGIATALVLGTFATVPAASAQEITLRAADSFPSGHYIGANLIQVFMDTVSEKTGGKVAFEYFPAQQLGKSADMLSLTQSGVTDIGYVGPSYVSDKMPLSSVGELPEAAVPAEVVDHDLPRSIRRGRGGAEPFGLLGVDTVTVGLEVVVIEHEQVNVALADVVVAAVAGKLEVVVPGAEAAIDVTGQHRRTRVAPIVVSQRREERPVVYVLAVELSYLGP